MGEADRLFTRSSWRDCTGLEVDGCYVHYAAVVEQHMNLYFGAYFWLRVVVAHLVPCSVLVVWLHAACWLCGSM